MNTIFAIEGEAQKDFERKDSFSPWELQQEVRYFYAGQKEIGAADRQKPSHELRLLGKGQGMEIGAAVALELSGEVYVPIHDTQGNCAALLNLAGETVESYRYSAFGQAEIFDGNGNRWNIRLILGNMHLNG